MTSQYIMRQRAKIKDVQKRLKRIRYISPKKEIRRGNNSNHFKILGDDRTD